MSWKSAVSGKFVSAWYALRHPRTTYKMKRKKKQQS